MGFCRPASGFPALSVDHPSALVGLQHFHDWLEACTMQSCLYSQRNGPEKDGRTRCSGLSQRAAPQALFCKYCKGSGTLATMKRWNQYRGELHAPPHIPRRPTSWERLVYGVPIGQSNRLGCQRPGCGHVTMMGSKTAPSLLQAIYRHVLSPLRCVTGPSW